MTRLLRIAEGMLWAFAGILLNMAGVVEQSWLFLPGVALSLGGLAMMTLALSERWREQEGVLGTSRDVRTAWALRSASASSLVATFSSIVGLFSGQAGQAPEVLWLVIGGIGLLISMLLLIRAQLR